MQIRQLGAIVLFCWLAGCGGPRAVRTIEVSRGERFTHASPAQLGQSIHAVQKFRGKYQKRNIAFVSQIEVSPKQLVLAGLSAAGNRIFLLEYADQKVELTTSQFFAAPFEPEYILADFQLVYWPLDALRSSLARSKLVLSSHAGGRTLATEQGKVIDIEFEKPDPWQGKVRFTHFERGYSFEIDTVEFEKL